jgi:chemotaxis protein MotB
MTAIGRRRSPPDIWPGFVDALANMLMVIIFLLMVYVLGQFFLGQALSGRDETLGRLQSQIGELAELLALERKASADLRADLGLLSSELQSSVRTRDDLQATLRALEQTTRDAQDKAAAADGELRSAFQTIMADKATIETQLADLARLDRQVQALQALKADLEKEIAATGQRLDAQGDALAKEREISESARAQLALLNQQMTALRNQLASLQAALDASEKLAKDQNVQISDLGSRLNAALAAKVDELSRYRSEFFGRLRTILGNRPDLRVVGDRFVFQSEVLFDTGSATLGEKGQQEVAKLGQTLVQLAGQIPPDINWILRVDGHTDDVPIRTAYASNWELSTARAISVVRALIAQGVPPERLAATGFGEFQPIDAGSDEIARRRNRRIELKLTER